MHTVVPAQVGSKSFDLVAWSEEGREDGGVRSSELVTLVSIVDCQMFLPFILHNSPHLLDVLYPTFHAEPSSSGVVFLSVTRDEFSFISMHDCNCCM